MYLYFFCVNYELGKRKISSVLYSGDFLFKLCEDFLQCEVWLFFFFMLNFVLTITHLEEGKNFTAFTYVLSRFGFARIGKKIVVNLLLPASPLLYELTSSYFRLPYAITASWFYSYDKLKKPFPSVLHLLFIWFWLRAPWALALFD